MIKGINSGDQVMSTATPPQVRRTARNDRGIPSKTLRIVRGSVPGERER
jgi:hypothetical protein